jgi:hypothetical protein
MKMHNEKLHNLHSPSNIIRAIKSGRTRWTGHVVRMEETINAYKILFNDLKGRNHSSDLGVDKTNSN